jgi:hypothetical protein
MNTKVTKSIIGATLAIIMIASIFAAIAPTTTADDVQPLANLGTGKTGPATAPAIAGTEINFTLSVTNTDPAFNWTGKVWDEPPPGGTYVWVADVADLAPSATVTFYYEYTVTASDVVNGYVLNSMYANGTHDSEPPVEATGSQQHNVTLTEEEPPELVVTFRGTDCLEVELDGSASTVASGRSFANHRWYFGDTTSTANITGAPTTVTHLYTDGCGPYFVTLEAWDNESAYASLTEPIAVSCGPTARAESTPTCFESAGTMVEFDGSASTAAAGRTIASYSWTFDDGETGDNDNGAVTTREVNGTSAVTATLTVTDDLNCTDVDTAQVDVCSQCKIRVYGTFGEGPGVDNADDKRYPLYQAENWPYSDPIGPFYPQSDEAPRKDFITFNPAFMEHNDGYADLYYELCNDTAIIQEEQEKVSKRLWYEKEWFKDSNENGEWDVVTSAGVMTLSEWEAKNQWERPALVEHNNPDVDGNKAADTYAPAINQEFTYMALDGTTMPVMIGTGSRFFIPMASDGAWGSGLNSFDADGDGTNDFVVVKSEYSLAQEWGVAVDLDEDGIPNETIDMDTTELNGNESVIFALGIGPGGVPPITMNVGDTIEFFDFTVTLTAVLDDAAGYTAIFDVRDNDIGTPVDTSVYLTDNEVATFSPADVQGKPVFYLKTGGVGSTAVAVEMGRLFGETYANIQKNEYRNQKALIVNGVFYNVVAIKGVDDCFKYITIRQKLPKTPIKIFGKHLKDWPVNPLTGKSDILPEMAPFSMPHNVLKDIQKIDPANPPSTSPIVKIGAKEPRPALQITYVDEDVEERYKGALLEIYNESLDSESPTGENEFWNEEWFWTLPWQYTEFLLPANDTYLVTLSWTAPESEITLWDGPDAEVNPVAIINGSRFKFVYEDCSGPLYIDRATSSIRLYGTYDKGAGYRSATDVRYPTYTPENWPYSDPQGPFYPQSDEAPEKDFITFDPAIMTHNRGYPLYYDLCNDTAVVQEEKEKVFGRLWYEKEWFKDSNESGAWDVVIEQYNSATGKWDIPYSVMTLAQWEAMPDHVKITQQLRVRQQNNPNVDGDIRADTYGPAIIQEFTYMTVDSTTMPIMVATGSKVLIPMASDGAWGSGLNSFDADGDTERDAVSVESEYSLAQAWDEEVDLDEDGIPNETIDMDATELNGNESVIFTLSKLMDVEDTIEFFDFTVTLSGIIDSPVAYEAILDITDNNIGTDVGSRDLAAGEMATFSPADVQGNPCFFVRVTAVGSDKARVEVGRLFGETYANIQKNEYRNQKALIVNGVFYNVVAIKGVDDCFKYITFRQKLPKDDIKIFGVDLKVWAEEESLAEMAPFSETHDILKDVVNTWTVPLSQLDKVGEMDPDKDPLIITYVEEDVEDRFLGELKEIYNETENRTSPTGWNEFWNVEWFHTYPEQYTAFVLPADQLYLVTLAWYAPEAEITLWDADPNGVPVASWINERVKFWYDPADNTDIYINRIGEGEPEEPAWMTDMALYYDMATYGGNGNGLIEVDEVIQAIMDYIGDVYPFGQPSDPDPFNKTGLIAYILDFLG